MCNNRCKTTNKLMKLLPTKHFLKIQLILFKHLCKRKVVGNRNMSHILEARGKSTTFELLKLFVKVNDT